MSMGNAATPPPVAPVEVTSVEAPVETPVEQQDEISLSIEDLLAADFGDDPVMTGMHKGIPDYKKILEHIPENGRKLIQNLRSSYTQKTQEIADLRRQVESERQQLESQRALLSESAFAKNVRELATKEVTSDPWSDDGLQERINKKAAEMMQQMLEPLQNDLADQRRSMQMEQFKSQHPDLTSAELRVPIAQLLMERPELKLEDAYFIVKGQVSKQQSESARQAQRDVLKKTSVGTAVRNVAPPKFKNAWEAYQWHKAKNG